MTTGIFFVLNFWKGKRKEKDSPTPPASDEQRQYLEEDCIKERITEADLFKLVCLPPSLDYNEWLATHTISFFDHVNLMYGVVSEYCTPETCPAMTAPGNVQYFWHDDKGKKYKYPASQYIDYVMSFIQKTITDETVFPTKFGEVFPSSFETIVKKIHKCLFHVLAHIFHAHYKEAIQLGIHGHINSLFTHFMVFNMNFELLEEKDTDIMQDLVQALIKSLQDHSNKLKQEIEEQNNKNSQDDNMENKENKENRSS
ncbi:MOB kinase activator 2 isoform X1 [Patella vulgata]|uniref:MOB kinase activator 2 isoform X1 n=1 Tax=Patella vulgata TaxID=6465 RepID=UPI0021806CEF|nr:MOB kinase activator 2 isoform X1 [Patella vulgata]XP_050410828.1 MOB kinase activator 2 isoform X1 [Patella vulgata]